MASSNIYTSNFRRCYSAAVSRRVRSVRALLARLPDKYRVCSSRVTRGGIAAETMLRAFFLPFRFHLAIRAYSNRLRNSERQYFRRGYRDRYGDIKRRINDEAGGSYFAPHQISAVTAFDLFVSQLRASPSTIRTRAIDGTKDRAHYRFFSRRRATEGDCCCWIHVVWFRDAMKTS